MANINVTSPGTYTVGDGDKIKIKDPGGDVTIEAPAGDDNVDKITIQFEQNDGISDKVTIDLSTFDEDDLQIDVKGYDPSDELVLEGATITGVDPSDSSKLNFTYVGEDGNTYTGVVHLRDKNEDAFGDEPNPIIICFTDGALIQTLKGEIPVEDLEPGDMVLTRDNGYQPIRWIGSRRLGTGFLARNPDLYPIRIGSGALGNGLPTRALSVSPQHRMCLGDRTSQLLFGHGEFLVAAKYLTNGSSIKSDHGISHVTYYHLLFDDHQIVFANGTPSESLFPGDMALRAIDRTAAAEIFSLFPELRDLDVDRPQTALPVLKAYETRIMDKRQGIPKSGKF